MTMNTPNGYADHITYLQTAFGFSYEQAVQIAWCEFWESRMYGASRRFHVGCKDCKCGADFVSASSARDFIARSHKGHKTTSFSRKG